MNTVWCLLVVFATLRVGVVAGRSSRRSAGTIGQETGLLLHDGVSGTARIGKSLARDIGLPSALRGVGIAARTGVRAATSAGSGIVGGLGAGLQVAGGGLNAAAMEMQSGLGSRGSRSRRGKRGRRSGRGRRRNSRSRSNSRRRRRFWMRMYLIRRENWIKFPPKTYLPNRVIFSLPLLNKKCRHRSR